MHKARQMRGFVFLDLQLFGHRRPWARNPCRAAMRRSPAVQPL